MDINYTADGEVIREFLKDRSFASLIRGPIGSGKSVALVMKIATLMCEQKPSPRDNVRYTRFAVIRRTNPMLKTTTIKTWLQWIPETGSHGVFKWSPPFTHKLRFMLPDKTIVDSEIIFMALDRPGDRDKLLSLELTGACFNEAREIDKGIIDDATGRVGRYPSALDGGPTWSGIILDTNAPDEDHWWAIMSGDVPPPEYLSDDEKRTLIKPKGWKFFTQPPAMLETFNEDGTFKEYVPNPERENRVGVPDEYYAKAIQGKSKDWIDIYVLNKYGHLAQGKPVYPSFKKETHVAKEPIPYDSNVPVFIGLDFGRTPCAVFCHVLSDGRMAVFHELQTSGMGADRFAQALIREMALLGIDERMCQFWGDPSGDYMAQSDDKTPFRILKANGVPAKPTNTNDPIIRIGAVDMLLNGMVNGMPQFVISPTCKILVAGFDGGYMYRRLNTTTVQYEDKPYKNKFSHLHDALQYASLGAGFGKKLVTSTNEDFKPKTAKKTGGWSIFGRYGL